MREQHALQLLEYLYILYTTFNVFKYSTPFSTTEMIRLGFARRIQLSTGHGLKHWVFNQTVHEYDESKMTACVKLCDLGFVCFFVSPTSSRCIKKASFYTTVRLWMHKSNKEFAP